MKAGDLGQIPSALPVGLISQLRREVGGDIVSVYTSDPVSPFGISSYILVGAEGIQSEYEPRLRGPLVPSSLALFSATDNLRELVVTDVAEHSEFDQSGFIASHHIRSLVRLSVPVFPPGSDTHWLWRRKPSLLEVFISFTDPQSRERLEGIVTEARLFFDRHMEDILEEPSFREVLNPRKTARKYRRLDEIAARVAELGDSLAPAKGVLPEVNQNFKELSRFIIDSCVLDPKTTTLSFHYCYTWSDEDRDPILVWATPSGRFDGIKRSLVENPDRGLLRYCARTGNPVVFEDISKAPQEWQDQHISVAHKALSITVPLYSGSRLSGILNIESDATELTFSSAATLWRMIPQIERLFRELLTLEALVQNLDAREAIQDMSSLPLSPLETAIDKRLEVLRGFVQAYQVSFIAWERESDFAREKEHREEPRKPPERFYRRAPHLRRFFEKYPEFRILHYEQTQKEQRLVRGYVIDPKSKLRPVQRLKFKPRITSADDADLRESSILETKSPLSIRSVLVVPLWHGSDSEVREVKGLLSFTYKGMHYRPNPLEIFNLDSVARSFGMSAFSIAKASEQASIFAWATAGVGPVHQLIKVIDECRRDLEVLEGDPERKASALLRIDVFREQLRIWHQFSHPSPTRDGSDGTSVPLGEVVRSSVERAQCLTGEVTEIATEILPEHENFALLSNNATPINAVLSCAISNSTRYGIGFDRVTAHVDEEAKEVCVRVENRAIRDKSQLALDEAANIARGVSDGNTVQVFQGLAARAESEGLRGLGTWLAARVTKDLLRGRYLIRYEDVEDYPDELLVIAEIRLPLGSE